MRSFLILLMLCVSAMMSHAQDRHGQSNGTIQELPKPKLSQETGTVIESPRVRATRQVDPVIRQIEANYQARFQKIATQLDNASSAEFAELSRESASHKTAMEIEILERFRELAVEQDDPAAVDGIDLKIAHIEQLSAKQKTRPTRKTVPEVEKKTTESRESKSAGGSK